MRRSVEQLHKLIQLIDTKAQGKHFFVRIPLVLFMFILMALRAALFLSMVLFLPKHKSFEFYYEPDPSKGYTMSYSEHVKRQNRARYSTLLSAVLVVIFVSVFRPFTSLAAFCGITTDTTVDQAYIDGNSCDNITVTADAVLTFTEAINLGGIGNYAFTIDEGVKATFDGAFELSDAGDSLVIDGIVTHAEEDVTGVEITAGIVTISATGSIDVDQAGCASVSGNGYGPDTGNNGVCTQGTIYGGGDDVGGGGSHVSPGGQGSANSGSGAQYDDQTNPIYLGASGAGTDGGSGGGIVRITASDTITVNGDITADGGVPSDCSGTTYCSGGGAGGSIYINTATLTGSGTIGAYGGTGGNNTSLDSRDGGGGAGGAVAVIYDTLTTLAHSNILASEGPAGANASIAEAGAPGSTYILDSDDDDLAVTGSLYLYSTTDASRRNITAYNGSTIQCSGTYATLNFSATQTIDFQGTDFYCSNVSDINVAAATFSTSNTNLMDFTTTATSVDFDITNDLTLNNVTYNGARVGTSDGNDGLLTLDNAIAVSLVNTDINASISMTGLTSFSIDATSSIDASGLGCGPNSSNGYTPNLSNPGSNYPCAVAAAVDGFVVGGGDSAGGGAAYGGNGGAGGSGSLASTEYGDVLAPELYGSGGAGADGGSGGGRVRIGASGIVTLVGTIDASGTNGQDGSNQRGGGGSGGSVYITGATITGSGTIDADGGNGGDSTAASGDGGGASGGRVALSANDVSGLTLANITADNGVKGPGALTAQDGENGTAYILDADDDDLVITSGYEFQNGDDSSRANITAYNGAEIRCEPGGFATLAVSATETIAFQGVDWECLKVDDISVTADTFTTSNTNIMDFSSEATSVDFNISNDLTLNNLTYTGATPGTSDGNDGLFTLDNAIALALVNTDINSSVEFQNLTSLNIDADSSINADELGCQQPGSDANGGTPDLTDADANYPCITAALVNSRTTGGGDLISGAGGYGGEGGEGSTNSEPSLTYGTESNPIYLGSSGAAATAGAGGGRIYLEAANGTATVNGALSANGAQGTDGSNARGGGGSGGSIYLSALTITGSGTVTADGGVGGDSSGAGTNDGGGGGGGRIAFFYATDSSSITPTASGAAAGAGATAPDAAGQDGTTYTLQYTAPSTPSITSPLSNTYNNGANLGLTGSTYASNGYSHTTSDWQISDDNTFSDGDCSDANIVWCSLDSSNKESITVNTTNGSFQNELVGQTALASNTTYYARVRYTNGAGDSTWSSSVPFTTAYTGAATSQTWDFDIAGDYVYNDSYISVTSGEAILDDLGGGTYSAASPLTGWSRRKPVTIDNSGGAELTNYQVKVDVTYDSDMQADFDDVRFLDADNKTEIDYWLESKTDSTSAVFWVEVPTVTADDSTVIYMYYGNGSATSDSDGSAVFTFFDDFETFTGWSNYSSGTVSQSTDQAYSGTNSLLKSTANDTSGGVKSLGFTLDRNDHIFEFFGYRPTGTTGGAADRLGVVDGSGNGYSFHAQHANLIRVDERTSYSASTQASVTSGTNFPKDDWYVGQLVITDSILQSRILDSSYSLIEESTEYADTTTTSFTQIAVQGGYDFYIDALRIRAYTATEPSLSLGTETSLAVDSDLGIAADTDGDHPAFASLFSFTENLGGSNAGTVEYQIGVDTDDDGVDNWYYHDGTNWSIASDDAVHRDTAATVNSYLPAFVDDVSGGDLYFKAFLLSNGSQPVHLDSVVVTYNNPPVLSAIPTQNFTEDVDEIPAFDLDDYFSDPGDTLSYSVLNGFDAGLGTMTLNGDGTVDFVLADNATGSDTIQFRATDAAGLTTDSNVVAVNVAAVNDAPTANAGPDQDVNEDDDVTLDGTGSSDVEGSDLTYAWTETADTSDSCSLDANNIAEPGVTITNRASSYSCTFSLVVNDGTQDSAADTIVVNVTADDDAPTANAGADQGVTEDDSPTLDGTASSDVEGQDLTYAWTETADTSDSCSLDANNVAEPGVTLSNEASSYTCTFSLVVNDGTSDSAADEMTLSVTANDDGPTANAGADQAVDEGDAVTLDGTGSSDPEGQELTYSWTETSDTSGSCSLDATNIAEPGVSLTNRASGYTCTFSLTVNDGTTTSAADSMTLTVAANDDAPTANAGADQAVDEGDAVTLDGTGSSDPENQSLTYSWTETADAANACSLDANDEAEPGVTLSNKASSYTCTFSLVVNDGTSDSASDEITLTVTANDDGPTANAGGDKSVDEGDTVTLDGTGSSDPENQDLTYTWTETADTSDSCSLDATNIAQPGLTLTNRTSGYTCSFSLVVNDGTTDSDADTMVLTVAANNDAPTANAGADQNVTEDDSPTLDGTGSSDPENQDLTYTWTETVDAADACSLDANDEAEPGVTLSNEAASYTCTFSLTVNDGVQNSTADTITLNVTANDDAPTANAGADQNVTEDDTPTLDGTSSSDPESQDLTYTWAETSDTEEACAISATDEAQPTVSLDNAASSYACTFSLTVNDGTSDSVADTITVNVTADDDAPTANAGTDQNVTEDDTPTLDGTGSTDPESQNLTYLWAETSDDAEACALSSTTASQPTVSLSNETASYTCAFSLVVNDGTSDSSSDTITLSVTANNDTPTANAGADQAVTEDDSPTLTAAASSDPEGESLTYTWLETADTSNACSLSDTGVEQPSLTLANKPANYSCTYRLTVSDGNTTSLADFVTVSVTADNDIPTADAGVDVTINEESSSTQLNGTGSSDPDGQGLSYSWTEIQDNDNGCTLSSASSSQPTVTVLNLTEDYSCVYRLIVNDGTNNSPSDSVTVNVITDNDAPVFTGTISAQATDEDNDIIGAFDLDDFFSDADTGDSCTYSAINDFDAALGTMTINGDGTVDFNVAANASGTDTVQFRCTDLSDATADSNEVEININAENDIPVASAGADQAVTEDDSPVTLDGSGSTDVDGDELTYSWTETADASNACLLSSATAEQPLVTLANRTISYTCSYSLTVNDGTVDSDADSITVTVTADNEAPSFSGTIDNQATDEDNDIIAAFDLDDFFTDADVDDSCTYSASNGFDPALGTMTINDDGRVDFAVEDNANGTDTVAFQCTDGSDASATSNTVTITIAAINDTPTADAGPDQAVNEDDGTATLTAAESADVDGDTLTYTWSELDDSSSSCVLSSTTVEEPTVTLANRTASYTCSYTLIVNDGTVDSSSDTMTLSVVANNDAPTAVASGDDSVEEEDSVDGQPVSGESALDGSSSSDPEGQTLTYSWIEILDSADACSLDSFSGANPTFSYDNTDSSYSCEFRLVVNDGTNNSAADTISVNISADNDRPVFTQVSDKTVNEEETLTFSVGANDVDTVTVELRALDEESAFAAQEVEIDELFTDNGNNTGTFEWTPSSTNAGSYQATFQADDGENTVDEIVNISVQDTNAAPTFSGSIPSVTFAAGTTTDVVYNLSTYFSDLDGDTLTYSATGNDKVSVAIESGNVKFSAPNGFVGTEVLHFIATDPDGQAAQSNGFNVSVSQALDTENINFVKGKSNGSGVIRVIDNDGNVVARWRAFKKGGVVPRLEVVDGELYVLAVKKQSGSTMHVYDINGNRLKRKKLSPKLHWRTIGTGNLDKNENTIEVVTATKHKSSIRFKLFTYNPNNNTFKLRKRWSTRKVPKKYKVTIKRKTIFLRNGRNKIVKTYQPFLKQ